MISTHSRYARRGFSLIEVAISLVIFVIGALAIIRIFPGALKVIGNNGNQQIASNLNSSVATSLKTEALVPSATFNIGLNADGTLKWTTAGNADHTADYADDTSAVLGVPRFNNGLPTTQDINAQTNNSALARYRGVLGEQGRVFQVGTDYFTTTQFPVSVQDTGGTLTPLAPTISQEYIVRNARMNKQRQISFADATTTAPDGTEYRLNDPSAPASIVTKNNLPAGSVIYISYRYYNNNAVPRIWGVSEEAVPITAALTLADLQTTISVNPPTTTRGAFAPYNGNLNTGTVAENIDVRVKRIVGPGVFPGADDKAKVTAARCGIVQIPTAVSTDAVSVDYIADWSWLMQKGNPSITPDETPITAPATGRTYRQIALGVPFIEDQATVGIYSALLEPVAWLRPSH